VHGGHTGGALAALLHDRHVVTDDAPADGAKNGVVARVMARDPADDGAGDATSLGRRSGGEEERAEGEGAYELGFEHV
jgi:hypothetical protein